VQKISNSGLKIKNGQKRLSYYSGIKPDFLLMLPALI
jgi:hypothetical protein